MPSSNGQLGPKKGAVLYARVSTQEQATKGYSLEQQLEAGRGWAAREGYEVIEEVADPGESGAYLERPGLDRVRDLVEGAPGGVSVVWAQDADRITREPIHRAFLDDELGRSGARLVALDDWGDNTHEGELLKYLKGWVSKGERLKIAERTRRGLLKKARSGKVVGTHRPRYGFRYNEAKDGYEVDEGQMAVVRRIFRMAGAEGMSLYAVREALKAAGVPSPGGAKLWRQGYLREAILDDVYRPHAFGELEGILSPGVRATLDPDQRYGVLYYDRRRQSKKKVANEAKSNGKPYRYAYETTEKPREGWIPIPVPDSGIPREWIDAAREAIKGNRRPSSAGLRFWELSGGILRCASCGRAMQTTSIPSSGAAGNVHHYYRCPKRVRDRGAGCENAKNQRADHAEPAVWEKVSGLVKDPEKLRAGFGAMIERKRARLKGNPDREAAAWLKRLDELARQRAKDQEMFRADAMTLDELKARQAGLEEDRLAAEQELAKLRGAREEIEALKRDAEALLASYEEVAPEMIDAFSPEKRHRAYKAMRLEVFAHPDGSLTATGDLLFSVSTQDSTGEVEELYRVFDSYDVL